MVASTSRNHIARFFCYSTGMQVLTVSQFVQLINEALGAVAGVTVEGEVEEYKVIQGKWVVFDLKDEKSLVKCFMPVWNLSTQLEDGMLVRATGQPKLREKGFFSFSLDDVQPTGEGALKRAFELLKKKLEAEGLFASERKRVLPRFPEKITLITSRDAAAFGDFQKVLKARRGGLTIYFIHAAVQGTEAPAALAAALERANTSTDSSELIVMVRGGGSLEDLQAFNDERVVRAVAASRLPTVVGIGHERDVSLAELAADLRASTPSNAAELIAPTREELQLAIQHFAQRLSVSVREQLNDQQSYVLQAMQALRHHFTDTGQNVRAVIVRLFSSRQRFRQRVMAQQQRVETLVRLLQSFSPETVLKRGYSISYKDGRVLKRAVDVAAGDTLVTKLAEGQVTATVGDHVISQLELKL